VRVSSRWFASAYQLTRMCLTVVEKPTIATHPTKFIPDIEKTTWPTFGGQPVRHTTGKKGHQQKKMTKSLLTAMATITGNLWQPSLMTKIALSLKGLLRRLFVWKILKFLQLSLLDNSLCLDFGNRLTEDMLP